MLFLFFSINNGKIINNFYGGLFSRLPNSKALFLSFKTLSFIRPKFLNHVFYRLKENVDKLNEQLLTDFYEYFKN